MVLRKRSMDDGRAAAPASGRNAALAVTRDIIVRVGGYSSFLTRRVAEARSKCRKDEVIKEIVSHRGDTLYS